MGGIYIYNIDYRCTFTIQEIVGDVTFDDEIIIGKTNRNSWVLQYCFGIYWIYWGWLRLIEDYVSLSCLSISMVVQCWYTGETTMTVMGSKKYDPEFMEIYKPNKVKGDLAKKNCKHMRFCSNHIKNQQSEWDFTNKPREPQWQIFTWVAVDYHYVGWNEPVTRSRWHKMKTSSLVHAQMSMQNPWLLLLGDSDSSEFASL